MAYCCGNLRPNAHIPAKTNARSRKDVCGRRRRQTAAAFSKKPCLYVVYSSRTARPTPALRAHTGMAREREHRGGKRAVLSRAAVGSFLPLCSAVLLLAAPLSVESILEWACDRRCCLRAFTFTNLRHLHIYVCGGNCTSLSRTRNKIRLQEIFVANGPDSCVIAQHTTLHFQSPISFPHLLVSWRGVLALFFDEGEKASERRGV